MPFQEEWEEEPSTRKKVNVLAMLAAAAAACDSVGASQFATCRAERCTHTDQKFVKTKKKKTENNLNTSE